MKAQRLSLAKKPLSKWPGYLLALFTNAKSFRDNPIIGSKPLNRLGLHVLRVIIGHATLRFRWLLLSPLVSAEDRKSFYQQGYIIKENILNDQQLAQLRAALQEQLPSFRQMRQGDTITHQLLLSPEQLSTTPALKSLTENPVYRNLQRFTSGFFLFPWVYFLRIENGALNQQKQDPQKVVHADAFHPTMKSWLFLEEVTCEKGPFTYYPGSHKLTWRRLKWEYRRSITARERVDGYSEKGSFRAYPEDIEELKLAAPKEFTVPANTLVIANTYGFHCRGAAAAGATRDAIWSSGWRAPFLPLPLPDTRWLRNFFHRQLKEFLT